MSPCRIMETYQGEMRVTTKDEYRVVVMEKVIAGAMTLKTAARRLGVSERQAKRLKKGYQSGGLAGIIHKSRGKKSNREIDPELKARVMDYYRDRYDGFGPTLASEQIAKRNGIEVNRETLRLWLIEAALWKRARKGKKHRSRRQPRERFGELVQIDGSHHKWFEGRRTKSCLMNMVDDATGTTLAMMAEEETTEAAMRLLWLWIERYGIPEALYCDLKSVYICDREATDAELLAGEQPLTVLGKACKKLGIRIIPAYSPQAKGRVERNHGVYQDRLVKELRLEEISTIEGANALLQSSFCDELNRRFAVQPCIDLDAHIPLPKGMRLESIFCNEENRVVSADWVVRYKNRFFQIQRSSKPLPRPKDTVVVAEWLDDSIHILFEKKEVKFTELDAEQFASLRKAV
jgi:transposase